MISQNYNKIFIAVLQILTLTIILNNNQILSFTLTTPIPIISSSNKLHQQSWFALKAGNDNNNIKTKQVEEDINPLTKASWYAVEAFGKIFKQEQKTNESKTTTNIDFTRSPASYKEALQRIKLDNERSYFLSGTVDIEAYDTKCIFSDPFVAFEGRQRFVDNLANLGSFITKYNARIINYVEDEENFIVQTKVMVKLELNLPWKPVLAWPWGVTYILDRDTLLITEHKEAWDVAPIEGVKQIFRKPTVKIS